MFCIRCGANTPEGSRFCSICGQSFDAPLTAGQPAVAAPSAPIFNSVVYAGFWRRVLAAIIDGVIFTPVIFIIGAAAAMAIPMITHGGRNDAALGLLMAGYFSLIAIAAVGGWLYYTLMESSKHRSTLGKMVAGIAVTDLNGNRISFARANGRYFGKWISGMTFYIGFIMAGFTEKKQALHDIIAGCLVIRK